MFEDQPTSASASKPAPASAAAAPVSDIVIHSLPKEFHDREVKVQTAIVPVAAAVPKPVPVPVTPIVPKLPPAVVPKRKSHKRLAFIIIALVLLFAAAGGAYVYTQGLLDAPVPIVTPEPIPEPTPTPTPQPPKPVSGADTDSDGLTNVEELLYGTDFRNPDSDGDTFLDGNEVFHRFDPIGLAPSTLLDTGAVRVLESIDLPFTIFYPTTWNPVSTPASQRVTFRAANGSSINVVWQIKATEQTLAAWYEAQVGEVDSNRLQGTTTKEGYAALIGPDERVMYIEAGDGVYTVMYELGQTLSIEFLQTFKMMVNSFKLVP